MFHNISINKKNFNIKKLLNILHRVVAPYTPSTTFVTVSTFTRFL